MPFYKNPFSCFFLLGLLLSLAACDNSEKNILVITDNIRIDRKTDLERLSTSAIGDLLYSPLMYVDENFKPHNVLAEEIKILPGNRTIEVKLRDGIRFHNGNELTSYDLVRNVDRLREKGSDIRYKNIRAEAIDRLRLKLSSDMPISDIEPLLSNIYALPPVLSEDLTGTGPFKLGRWLNNGVELVANDEYFEGRAKIDKVIYVYEEDERKRIYKLLSGEADLLAFLSPDAAKSLERDVRFYINKNPSGLCQALFFNTETPIFKDRAVRMAAAMAIDRTCLIEKGVNGAGVKTSGPFRAGTTTNTREYSPKLAVRLLKDAGWKDTNGDGILEKDGKNLSFRLFYLNEVDNAREVLDILSKNFFEVGIGMESSGVDDKELRNYLSSGNYEAVLYGVRISDRNNFVTWHSSMLGISDGNNFSRYANIEVDGLLERMADATEVDKKNMIYAKIAERLDQDAPAAFLYEPVFYSAASRRIRGAENFRGDVFRIYQIKDLEVIK